MVGASPRKKPKSARGRDTGRSSKRSDGTLIADLIKFLGRYVVMTDAQKVVLAVYVIHTHVAEHCDQTPYVFVHSPEPECGKSRLMEVLELLVAKPWLIVNPSDAVLFRMVDKTTPTLLWDEIDAVFAPKSAHYHEEQRGMLDQGHRRYGRVPRFVGDKVVEFGVYCPKVFAGIGTLPDTLSRRSIPISLKRRSRDELIEDFIRADVEPEAVTIRGRIADWADRRGEAVATTRPTDLPPTISDRMREGCFSLFSIADALGAGTEVRKALEELLTGDRLDNSQTMRVRLLTDLRVIFAEEYRRTGRARRFMSTDTLLQRLYGFEESPWASYYGRGLEAKDMADLLRQYGIHPRQVKLVGEVKRGYRRDPHGDDAGLADAWVRYLGADETTVDPNAR